LWIGVFGYFGDLWISNNYSAFALVSTFMTMYVPGRRGAATKKQSTDSFFGANIFYLQKKKIEIGFLVG